MNSIVVFAALKSEANGVIRSLELSRTSLAGLLKLYRGAFREMEVLLAITGVGTQRSGKIAAIALEKLRPDCIFNLGSAGSLHSSLEPGTVFIPDWLIKDDKTAVKQDDAIIEKLTGFCRKNGHKCRTGKLITLKEPVNRSAFKNRIYKEHDALAVDMEACQQALLAQRSGIPFVCLKIISDGATFLAVLQYWRRIKRISGELGEIILKLIPILEHSQLSPANHR